MPEKGVRPMTHGDVLSYEELIRVVRGAASLGVRKVRITGGEPLVRTNLTHLVASIRATEGIEDISLTTNGLLLKRYAQELASAGLKRVNVSLDSLKPERYSEITRGGDVAHVLEGIEEAERAGLLPVKINMVPMRGFNDDELETFARLTVTTPLHVRFIEFMPTGGSGFWNSDRYIPTEEIKERVSVIGPLEAVKARRSGPARYFRFPDAQGVVGFISAITHHFCGSCNRLRLTSEGKLRPCLFSETEIDLKSPIREGCSDEEIERLLRLAVEVKPQSHSIAREEAFDHLKPMSTIGG
jgi:cyclic pyranopterin phosphate synthase